MDLCSIIEQPGGYEVAWDYCLENNICLSAMPIVTLTRSVSGNICEDLYAWGCGVSCGRGMFVLYGYRSCRSPYAGYLERGTFGSASGEREIRPGVRLGYLYAY